VRREPRSGELVRFAILASGSSGNATVVEADGTLLLIDCGLSVRRLGQRAAELGFDLAQLSAIAVTHEHSDHIGGVARLAERFRLPVYMTHGTRSAASFGAGPNFELTEISPHEPFRVGPMTVRPAPVPHDAREPCQFVVEHGQSRLGVLTDLGSDTRFIQEHFADCCALVLEFNHDSGMLANCAYPESVKRRIAGRLGHFNNDQASELLSLLHSRRLRHVLGAHVSANANSIELVRDALRSRLSGTGVVWDVAAQDRITPWISM